MSLGRIAPMPKFFLTLAALLIFVGSACSVSEDVRSNRNDPKYGGTGSSGAGTKPDLIVSAFTTAGSYTSSQAYNLQVTVKNQGNVATGDFTVGIFTGSSSVFLDYALAYSTTFAGKTIVPSLAIGASTTVTISFTPLFASHGLIGAYVDTTETVGESNESNNYKINNVIIN
jgi:subtilase family serine protease